MAKKKAAKQTRKKAAPKKTGPKPQQHLPGSKVETVAAVARVLGVDRRQVHDYFDRGCPGRITKSHYDLPAIVQWWGENIAGPKHASPAKQTSEFKAKLEEQKFRKQELEYAKECGAVVYWGHVKEFMSRVAARYRNAGDLLRRDFGEDAQKIVLDANAAAEKDLEGMFV